MTVSKAILVFEFNLTACLVHLGLGNDMLVI